MSGQAGKVVFVHSGPSAKAAIRECERGGSPGKADLSRGLLKLSGLHRASELTIATNLLAQDDGRSGSVAYPIWAEWLRNSDPAEAESGSRRSKGLERGRTVKLRYPLSRQ